MSDKDKRVISDGAHHSGLMKDYGGQYNPDYASPQAAELTRLREREAVLVEALKEIADITRGWGGTQGAIHDRAKTALTTHKPASDEIGE